ncbi:MAG TPA: hypothetical protein GXX24_05750 [Paracoccus solventivorans]|uniref:Polysaccharide export outer membrane protein n=1 Tax=Paracoccus solventivorans TaxID=53463 RepID=A0A832PMC9_9RHOB|nr:polysaccharide biosynthesis/export family protein [Paracoccus solventivorans]HHW33627.1 hypothetical protein [Paracoccus solventivorans]
MSTLTLARTLWSRARGLGLVAALALPGSALAAQELPAPRFQLAPGDVVEVSVFANEALSGQYPVREDGSLALHLIGAIPAAGLTPGEFEALLRERLAPIIPAPVSATVAVARWRPVAVLGAVAQPGLYDFSSGLDVTRAVALAGGAARLAADAPVTLALRVTEEAGRYQALKSRLAALLTEESRLLQERAGETAVPPPPEAAQLIGAGPAAAIAAEQQRLLALRARLHEIRTAGEEERRQLALTEAQSYADRRALSQRQVEVTERDLDNQLRLQEQGLSVASRVLQVNLAVDQYRSAELEAAAFEAAARQSASAAASMGRALVSQREEEITQRLAQVRQEIAETRATMAASRDILAEFGGGTGLADAATPPRYLVTRRIDGAPQLFDATPLSLLQPGDTLEVVPLAPDAAP